MHHPEPIDRCEMDLREMELEMDRHRPTNRPLVRSCSPSRSASPASNRSSDSLPLTPRQCGARDLDRECERAMMDTEWRGHMIRSITGYLHEWAADPTHQPGDMQFGNLMVALGANLNAEWSDGPALHVQSWHLHTPCADVIATRADRCPAHSLQ